MSTISPGTNSKTTADAVLFCPLCGQDNQCAVARGGTIEECWCLTTTIDHEALAAVPGAERGKRCLCPACGRPGNATGDIDEG